MKMSAAWVHSAVTMHGYCRKLDATKLIVADMAVDALWTSPVACSCGEMTHHNLDAQFMWFHVIMALWYGFVHVCSKDTTPLNLRDLPHSSCIFLVVLYKHQQRHGWRSEAGTRGPWEGQQNAALWCSLLAGPLGSHRWDANDGTSFDSRVDAIIFSGTLRNSFWYDDVIWCDVMWCDMIWYDMISSYTIIIWISR